MLTRIHPERIAAASHVPPAGCNLTHLTNDELIAGTRRLVGASNQIFAMLLAHLAEVEARGIHRERACSSLYTYCIYELRFSEDAAFRRVSAARLVKRFPALYDAVASGELHLTGLLMLGPHLTPENHVEVLGRAKHRTKKELGKLVRALDPLPDLPAGIEPLGPALARPATGAPAWSDFMESLCPPVRELAPDDAPRDWVGDVLEGANARAPWGNDGQVAARSADDRRLAAESVHDGQAVAESDHDGQAVAESDHDGQAESALERSGLTAVTGGAAPFGPAPLGPAPFGPALARSGVTAVTGPQRYGVQFSVQEEYVQLVERARALLSHAHSKSSLEEIHLRAMRLLVDDLEKRRFAKTTRPRRPVEAGAAPASETRDSTESAKSSEPREPAESDDSSEPDESSERRGAPRRGRHVPAATMRIVYERDEARCSYVDVMGQRCRETHRLDLHHLEPFARGGTHSPENVTLRCRAHNALAAEQDFGRACVQDAKAARRHESFTTERQRGSRQAAVGAQPASFQTSSASSPSGASRVPSKILFSRVKPPSA
jgi:hypothetical protein